MRHKVAAKHFNRDANQRKMLLRNLLVELIEHGHLTTTVTRAKEIRRISDKLIHKAQTDSLNTRRTLHRFFGRRDVVNTLVDRIAPVMKDRTSGFTRLVSAGTRRGDNSDIAKLSLVTMPDRVDSLKSGKTFAATVKKATKAVKPAKAVKADKAVETKTEVKAAPAAPKKAAAKKTTKKTA